MFRKPDAESQSIVEVDPVHIFSYQLTDPERNYDVGDKELLAIKLALKDWRHWLEWAKHPFLILTDQKKLTCVQQAKQLNPQQARCFLFFAWFDFVLCLLNLG